MAGLNVAEWTPDQVQEWLKGLGGPVEQYATSLRAHGLDGAKLLTLRCDDLEYLGMRIIGHQELLLEAVEHLRNFQYELSRECVQQLALRVSVAATGLARALAAGAERLETHALMDVARAVHAVKALVWWLARWPLGGGADLRARAGALLALCLQATTCAQRDRFAEQPARAVAQAAAAAAAVADHIIQDVADPLVLQPASLDAVTLRQGGKPLGFSVVPSLCGHLQLAGIRFGSPAHASGAVHEGDEIVQVGGQCVVGWTGAAVQRLCAARGAGELQLRLRRRPARPLPYRSRARLLEPLQAAHGGADPEPAAGSSSDSEPLSPPASPALPPDHARMYPPKPRAQLQRRHTVSGGSPAARRPALRIERFWQELQQHRSLSPRPEDEALYRRDKAVSCSTGLELSPRPRTCPGGPQHPLVARLRRQQEEERLRGKLDKSHSTPAYDFEGAAAAGPLAAQVIPESPPPPSDSPAVLVHSAEKADQILDFKKSSSQIGEAILQQQSRRLPDERDEFSFGEREGEPELVETLNVAVAAPERARGPSLRNIQEPPAAPAYPALRCVRAPEPPECARAPLRLDASQISLPLRRLTDADLALRVLNREPAPDERAGPEPAPAPRGAGCPVSDPPAAPASRGIFPAYKSKSLKKKNSLLAKRRMVAARVLAPRGAGGGVWQRVRARTAQQPRWARRYLLLHDRTLYAYRSVDGARAACMIRLAGFTAAAAGEVKSRPHAFKVYHTGTAFYFACESAEAARAWLDLIQRATHDSDAPTPTELSKQYSETDYSSESDEEGERARDRDRDRDTKDKDKSKFGSLKKITQRMQRSESTEAVGAASLDRKYLRFFSRGKHKDDSKPKSKQSNVPVPTEHYRSYRRVSQAEAPPAAPAPRAPKPHNYIHASNPNLLDFEKSDLGVRPVPARIQPPRRAPDSIAGFVTLEEFMLKKQEEERRQVYTNRVLLGVERGTLRERGASLRRRLERVVPDVLYGALPEPAPSPAPAPAPSPGPAPALQARELPRAPPRPERPERRDSNLKPVSVKGKDGYEKIVYTEEKQPPRELRMRRPSPPPAASSPGHASTPGHAPSPGHPVTPEHAPAPGHTLAPERWRDSLRRNDKVHSPRRVAPLAPLPAAAALESGSGAGGVSRLRLMFARNAGRDAPRQEPASGAASPSGPGTPTPGPGSGAPGPGPGERSDWAWRTHHYPHLQCPPTFQPETYSLASRLPRPPQD